MTDVREIRRSLDACRKSQRALLDKLNAAESALASARAAGAAEAFERAAKKCDERKVFYDGLAQQSYAEAEDDAESEGAPPDTTDGEFYEEKAGVCFQLAAAIRALAGEERK